MYLWKSWHDSRDRLMLYGGACLVIGVLVGVDHVSSFRRTMIWFQMILSGNPSYDSAHWHSHLVQLRRYYGDFVQNGWEWPFLQLFDLMPKAAIWSALALGATSVGREYGSGAIGFVLTRPQSRSRIIWEEWVAAIAEMGVILSMFYVGVLPFVFYTHGRNVSPSATPVLGILAVAACVCGLTQFLTMLTGSSMKGLSAAIAACLIYVMLPDALDIWWHIRWPAEVRDLSFTVLDKIGDRMLYPIWEVTIIWALFALIFPLLSQWLIERREV